MLNSYVMSLGESLSSGPFFKAYVVNLLPGQFVQPFISAAFSDLGLDPATLLPSQLTDPQTGQPGTPPLPMPYPRTGQGGEPRLNLPGGDYRQSRRSALSVPTGAAGPAARRSTARATCGTATWAAIHTGAGSPTVTTKLRRARAVLATTLVVVLVAGVIVAMRTAGETARTLVVAYFDNSNGVFAGDDVRIRGVPVGKILKIEPQPLRVQDFALVRSQIQSAPPRQGGHPVAATGDGPGHPADAAVQRRAHHGRRRGHPAGPHRGARRVGRPAGTTSAAYRIAETDPAGRRQHAGRG